MIDRAAEEIDRERRESNDRRQTEHQDAKVARSDQEIAEAEARNGLLQFDYAIQVIMESIDRKTFKLRPSLLLALHREALQEISASAGTWRSGSVRISGSLHQPVPPHLVPEQIENLCD